MQNEFLLHWLTFTVWEEEKRSFWLVLRLLGLEDRLPEDLFVLLGSGGRGYGRIYQTSEAVRVYSSPSDGDNRYTVEIPGEVLNTIPWSQLRSVFKELNYSGVRWQVSRCDYAFDLHLEEVSPAGIYQYLRSGGALFSMAKRDTISFISPVYAENGSTLTIGSRSSERFLRIYDKRGFTRVELETKAKRANILFRTLLMDTVSEWARVALSFLLDFVDFTQNSYWLHFKGSAIRAGIIIHSHLSLSVGKSIDWINKQVSPTLYMLAELYGIVSVFNMVMAARDKLSRRQEAIILACPSLNFF